MRFAAQKQTFQDWHKDPAEAEEAGATQQFAGNGASAGAEESVGWECWGDIE